MNILSLFQRFDHLTAITEYVRQCVCLCAHVLTFMRVRFSARKCLRLRVYVCAFANVRAYTRCRYACLCVCKRVSAFLCVFP